MERRKSADKDQKGAGKMRPTVALKIFRNLDSENYTDDDKALAIYEVASMPTHNGIKKDELVAAIK